MNRGEESDYFYVLTVRVINPTGGHERTASTSGTFRSLPGLTGETKFEHVTNIGLADMGLEPWIDPKIHYLPPAPLHKYAVLFYVCEEAGV